MRLVKWLFTFLNRLQPKLIKIPEEKEKLNLFARTKF